MLVIYPSFINVKLQKKIQTETNVRGIIYAKLTVIYEIYAVN